MFIDSNLLIYAAVNTEDVGERARKRLRTVRKAILSPLVFDEVAWKLRKYDPSITVAFMKHIWNNPEITIKPVHENSAYEMLDLMHKHNLKPRDALHVAVMLANKETEILSNDPDFDRVPGITRTGF